MIDQNDKTGKRGYEARQELQGEVLVDAALLIPAIGDVLKDVHQKYGRFRERDILCCQEATKHAFLRSILKR